ncbi:hypothetical protein BKA69DRAFT_872802 [Paraphysoderma sedebokerense]|nr:hypothetical protein BKA69DRAFT_872802 [Paraphysoderma sedebokerense]
MGWFLFPDREEKPRYYMASRRELVRELLVTPTEHVTNETFVTDVMVWQFIIRALRKELLVSGGLGIDGIAVNFGKWESAQAMDKYAQECHAHIHLHLTANASEELEQKYSSLKGRTGKPQDYNMENCQLLETTWLLSSLTSLTLHQLREVKDDVKGLKGDMDKLIVDVKALLDPRKLVLSLTEALKEVQKNDFGTGRSELCNLKFTMYILRT